MKKQTFLMDGKNHKYYLKLAETMRLPYVIIESNYTLEIKNSAMWVYFIQSEVSKKAFTCGAMVKRDLKKSGQPTPAVDREQIKYFNFAYEEILRRNSGRTIYNIDIKSAYATALNNTGLLHEDTFRFLCTIPKKDRLVSLGMLASRKEVYQMDANNNEISHHIERKDTEGWFFYCCLEIQQLMQDIQNMLGPDFLFYWVDGVFFTGDHKEQIIRYLESKGYKYSFDECTDFTYRETDFIKSLSYFKEGKEKTLSLPRKNNAIHEFILKHLKYIP